MSGAGPHESLGLTLCLICAADTAYTLKHMKNGEERPQRLEPYPRSCRRATRRHECQGWARRLTQRIPPPSKNAGARIGISSALSSCQRTSNSRTIYARILDTSHLLACMEADLGTRLDCIAVDRYRQPAHARRPSREGRHRQKIYHFQRLHRARDAPIDR